MTYKACLTDAAVLEITVDRVAMGFHEGPFTI